MDVGGIGREPTSPWRPGAGQGRRTNDRLQRSNCRASVPSVVGPLGVGTRAESGEDGTVRHLLRIAAALAALFAIVLLIQRFGNSEVLVVVLSLAVAAPVLYLVVDRFEQRHQVQRLREEALRAELDSLRAQINPHFFFNTLNNLYGLVVGGSARAPQLILALSNLMRFTIYEGQKDHVALRDELAYLESYLELQRLRSRLEDVEIRFDKAVEDELLAVPPLMLILLIENAIKHGVGSLGSGAFVHLRLSSGADWLEFTVANNYQAGARSKPGIGLANLERRLALLFPRRHRLTCEAQGGVFRAGLRLEL